MYDLRTSLHMPSSIGYLVTAITYKIKEDNRVINRTIFYTVQKYYFNILEYFQNCFAMYLHPDLKGELARP
jgi:hypothetical protein